MPRPNVDSVFTHYNARTVSTSTQTINISSTSANRLLVAFVWYSNPAGSAGQPSTLLFGGTPMSLVSRYQPGGAEGDVPASLWTIDIADGFSGDVAMTSMKSHTNNSMLVTAVVLSGVSIPVSSWTGRGSTTISGTGPYGLYNIFSNSTTSDLALGWFANGSGSTTTNQDLGGVNLYPGFSNITFASTDGASGPFVQSGSLFTAAGSALSSRFSTDPGPARWRNYVYLASGTTFDQTSLTTVEVSSIKTGINSGSWETFAHDLDSGVNAYYLFVNGAGASAYSAANPVVTVWVSDVTAERIWTGPYNGAASNAVDIWRARNFVTGSARTIALQRQSGSGYAPLAYAGFALTGVSDTTANSDATGAGISTSTSAPSTLTISGTLIPAAILLSGVNTAGASFFSAEGPVGGSGQDSVGTLADADSRKNNWASGYTSPHTWLVDADSSGRAYSWGAVVVYGGGSAPPAAGQGGPYYFLNQTRIGL